MSEADSGASPFGLHDVVEALVCQSGELLGGRRRRLDRHVLPSREALVRFVEDLRAVLFPGHFGAADLSDEGIRYFIGATLDAALSSLHEQVRRGFWFAGDELSPEECELRASEVVREFASRLPTIRALLASDVRAAFESDPAATSLDEAVFCYPGVTAVTSHRMAHELYALGVPLIPRIIAEHAHSVTGVDIHPGARICGSFFIDHGTGVVIGETTIIGDRVRLYQGVTLGARRFALDEYGRPQKKIDRHPIVEDDVVIYAGATVLGRITIGRGSSIGGNVWLTRSVPAGSRITQAQARLEQFEDGSGI